MTYLLLPELRWGTSARNARPTWGRAISSTTTPRSVWNIDFEIGSPRKRQYRRGVLEMIGDASKTAECAVIAGESERIIEVRDLRVVVFPFDEESPFLGGQDF